MKSKKFFNFIIFRSLFFHSEVCHTLHQPEIISFFWILKLAFHVNPAGVFFFFFQYQVLKWDNLYQPDVEEGLTLNT